MERVSNDLVAKSFETLSTSLETDKYLDFRFRVANEGTGKANGTINSHLSINGIENKIFTFTDLDAGYTATFTFQIAFGSPKTYDLAMNVNKNRTITESNYNNNSKTHSVNVVIGGSRVCLDVPEYTQQPYDKICWATSAAMVISYFLDDMTNRNVTIAKAEFGNDFNNGITDNSIMENYVENYTNLNGSIQKNPLSLTALKYQIRNDGPIITVIQYRNNRHAEVIKGFNDNNDFVIYNDPWDGAGHSASYSYYSVNTEWFWVESIFWR